MILLDASSAREMLRHVMGDAIMAHVLSIEWVRVSASPHLYTLDPSGDLTAALKQAEARELSAEKQFAILSATLSCSSTEEIVHDEIAQGDEAPNINRKEKARCHFRGHEGPALHYDPG